MRKKCAQGQRNEFCDILPWAQCTSSNCYHCILHAESWINFSLHFTFCLIPPCLLHGKILPFPLNASFPSILLAGIDPCDDCYFVNFRRHQRQKRVVSLATSGSWEAVVPSIICRSRDSAGQRGAARCRLPSEPQPHRGAISWHGAATSAETGPCWRQQG